MSRPAADAPGETESARSDTTAGRTSSDTAAGDTSSDTVAVGSWLDDAGGPPLTRADAVVAVPLLGLFWLLLGPLGLATWLAVVVAWAVGPAVVPVAIGQLAIGTLAGSADAPLLVVTSAGLFGILVRDGMKAGWDVLTGAVFAALAVGLGGSVLFLEARTSLLVTGLVLCGVIASGAFALARFVPNGRSTAEGGGTYE